VLRDYTGHASRRPSCKANPDSRDLTEQDWERLKAEFDEEETDPRGSKERRVAAAKTRQAQAWKPPDAATEIEYRMNFGKHSQGRGLTIKAVLQKDPDYFKALMSWKNNILESRADLKTALEKEGILDELVANRPFFQSQRASRMLDKIEEEKGQELHPEVKKLRALQQIEAIEILQGESKEDALAIVSGTSKAPKRKYTPTARVLLPHCSACGSTEHKRHTCPHKDLQGEGLPERSAVVPTHVRNKRQAAIVSRLKYTQIQLRSTEYENRATQMSRAPLKRSFLSLARASPGALANMLVEDKLISDLQGVPCPRQACKDSSKQGFLSNEKVLSQRCVNNEHGIDINTLTVYHRCDVCRVKQSITLHNPLFEGLAMASVMQFWRCGTA
jgi:hypothetical protein